MLTICIPVSLPFFLCLCNGFQIYQEDAFRSPVELIRSKGYKAEEYQAVTEDGYVLGLQRIPGGSRCVVPVLLVHGLMSSAVEWVLNFPDQSLGFLLSDAGYDVWLGNFRGTPYSRKHVRYSDKDQEYWNFRLDDVALFDIPALIDAVLYWTGQKQVFFVGFSQGNTAVWAMLADRPEYNDKIRLVLALAPVATMSYIKSPARFLVPFSSLLTWLSVSFNRGRVLVSRDWSKRVTYAFCESPLRYLCGLPTFFLFGVNLKQLNITRLPVYVSHVPSGAAKRNLQQFAQIIRARDFVRYDYGARGNVQRYGQARNPSYDLGRIEAPVALFRSEDDFFANPRDVAFLKRRTRRLRLCGSRTRFRAHRLRPRLQRHGQTVQTSDTSRGRLVSSGRRHVNAEFCRNLPGWNRKGVVRWNVQRCTSTVREHRTIQDLGNMAQELYTIPVILDAIVRT